MKWKTFFQIVLLLLIAGVIFYFVHPKYYFKTNGGLLRGNKITGKVMHYYGGKWIELKNE